MMWRGSGGGGILALDIGGTLWYNIEGVDVCIYTLNKKNKNKKEDAL